MSCTACPFACTDESEQIQNLGCLPSPWEILEMKKKTGHNWACHESGENGKLKLCAGMVQWVKEDPKVAHLNMKEGELIDYHTWYHHGEEAALAEASSRASPAIA